jgi:excisionase family DNA binding protein
VTLTGIGCEGYEECASLGTDGCRGENMVGPDRWPLLLTVDETAALLRKTRKGVYVMAERGLLPGVTRLGRRVLFRTDVLLHWLDQKSAPPPKE